nr:GTP-binding protein [Candidatus Omnitrophota bacterium]
MQKETIKIAMVGHVDHGKSTLIGRLLIDTDSLPKEKITEIKKLSKELGKEAELAFIVDQLKEEREQAKTIDTTQIFLKIKNNNFVLIDTPGHVELLKNMITGATQADIALLVIDINEGIMEQTKRHLYVLNMVGINSVIVIFNKMDLVDYKKERFNALKSDLLTFLENLNIEPVFIIPVSAKQDVNISKKCYKIAWYKGPSLLEAFGLLKSNTKSIKKSLRFAVQDIYKINNKKIIAGKMLSGILKKNQQVLLLPSNVTVTIKSLNVFGKYNKIKACSGENIGISLNETLPVKRGYILAQKENSPKLSVSFRGNILWLCKEPLKINKTINLRCSTQEVDCIVERIEKRIDSSTLNIIEENAKELRLNEVGLAALKTKKPIVIEKFAFIEELGRFAVGRDHDLIGIGVII